MFLRCKVFAIAAMALVQFSQPASARICLSQFDGFQLSSDTVHWIFAIRSGSECLQGLRGKTMVIDEVKILEPPSAGSLTISGSAFHYRAPATESNDRFRLEVSGQNLRVHGTSVINIEVLVDPPVDEAPSEPPLDHCPWPCSQ
jgi:hypothetical protein